MTSTIGDVLPAALAVALSPFPVIAITLVLTGPRRGDGWWFALGWLLGLTALGAVVVVLLGAAASSAPTTTDDGVAWGTLALGLLLLGLAVRAWRRRAPRGTEPSGPSWLSGLDDLSSGRVFALGLGLAALNPKNVVLVLAAGSTIATAALSTGGRAVTLAVFVLVGSLSVLALTVLATLSPSRASQPLDTARDFMTDHADAIVFVVLVLIGAKLVGDALGLLS